MNKEEYDAIIEELINDRTMYWNKPRKQEKCRDTFNMYYNKHDGNLNREEIEKMFSAYNKGYLNCSENFLDAERIIEQAKEVISLRKVHPYSKKIPELLSSFESTLWNLSRLIKKVEE